MIIFSYRPPSTSNPSRCRMIVLSTLGERAVEMGVERTFPRPRENSKKPIRDVVSDGSPSVRICQQSSYGLRGALTRYRADKTGPKAAPTSGNKPIQKAEYHDTCRNTACETPKEEGRERRRGKCAKGKKPRGYAIGKEAHADTTEHRRSYVRSTKSVM